MDATNAERRTQGKGILCSITFQLIVDPVTYEQAIKNCTSLEERMLSLSDELIDVICTQAETAVKSADASNADDTTAQDEDELSLTLLAPEEEHKVMNAALAGESSVPLSMCEPTAC